MKKNVKYIVASIIIVGVVCVCFLTYLFLLIFTNYPTVFNVWLKLKKIPNVEIITVKSGPGEFNAFASINVKNKGKMTFSWLIPEQFDNPSNMFYSKPLETSGWIFLSEIGSCSILGVGEKGDVASSNVILDKDVDPKITTVEKAIESYDEILAKVKSLPKYNTGVKKPGNYSDCK